MPALPHSEAFESFMASGWRDPDRTLQVVEGTATAAAAHRDRLSSAMPHQSIVVTSGRSHVRANDTEHDFRPDSDLVWLTGSSAEGAVLVMTPRAGGHDATLYVTEPAYAGERAFFEDALRGELWVGAAPGLTDIADALGITVAGLGGVAARLDSLPSDTHYAGTLDPVLWLGRATPPTSRELSSTLSGLRAVKDEWEIGQLRHAVDATVAGFHAVVRELPSAIAGGGERWLQGTFDRHARTTGNSVGYTTVMGSGPNSATLHWSRCDGEVRGDHVVLLDAGVEARSFYTADVTRTFPASGTFSTAQREVYDLVRAAHRAALAEVKPGALFNDFKAVALEVIATGLSEWGLLPVSLDEALSPGGQQHRRWCVCGNGHHLGLDVHDCARITEEDYLYTALEPGMVLTVEPGLYFHENDLAVPPELRGIGVRIEDDLLVSETGHDLLSAALPLDSADVEAWVASTLAP